MPQHTTPDGEDRWPGQEAIVTRREVDDTVNEASRGERTQRTFYISKEAVERLNAAVYWARGYAIARSQQEGIDVSEYVPDSASALVETAIWAEILRIEKGINHGKPFPPAAGRLRTGPGTRGVQRLSEPRGPRKTDQSDD
jgi:hypothetical protein